MIATVPNVSEGRRPDVIEALAEAVRQAAGAMLLDTSSDPSHNRTVLTIAGEEESLTAAILALYTVALERIDLRAHAGVHPRLGTVDVVPFVPLGATPMAACVSLARRVGALVADRFEVPIYLYGEAAGCPNRRPLEAVRRGEFEGLAARMADGAWRPDYGPCAPHLTAGASVIGARTPLIAFNVNLDSQDLKAAQDIAAAVRERGGGLPGVKALGVALAHRGIVQVSMNVTDHARAPLAAVVARVEREAARRGMAVLESELVGLAPAAAFAGVRRAALRLRDFSEMQILETALAEHQARRSGPAVP